MKNNIIRIINNRIAKLSKDIKTKIRSIYIFGSVVNGEDISVNSDIDIWYVISNLGIQERFSLTLTIYNINDDITNKLLKEKLINNKGHNPCVNTIDEFERYIKIYPTRVAYQIVKGYWYRVYGESFYDIAINYNPTKGDILNDFFILLKESESRLFVSNSYDFYKYAFRTIRKWLWYVSDYYIPNRWNVITCNEMKVALQKYCISIPDFYSDNIFNHGLEERFHIYDFLKKLRDNLMVLMIKNNHLVKQKMDLWGNGVWHVSSLISLFLSKRETINTNICEILSDIMLRHFNFIAQVVSNGDEVFKINYGYLQTPFEKESVCSMQWEIPDNISEYLVLMHCEFLSILNDNLISDENKVYEIFSMVEQSIEYINEHNIQIVNNKYK